MADPTLQQIIEQRHPVYRDNAPKWQFFADHYEGGPDYPQKINPMPLPPGIAVHPGNPSAQGGKEYGTSLYLWQYHMERTIKYMHRLARCVYVNIVAPVVDFYCATVGNPANIVTDDVEDFQEFLDDCDRQGKSLVQYMVTARKNATVRGHTFILVDSTKASGEVRTQRDANQQGIRPYLIEILPENLLNWRLDEAGKVQEILFRVKQEPTGSVLDQADQNNVWQYRFWSQKEWRVYREQEKGIVEQIDQGANPLGVVPIIPLYHEMDKPMLGKSLLKDAAKIGQLLTNWVSALDEAFEMQMFAIPVWKSRKDPNDAAVGVTLVMHLNPDENEDFKYVTPDTQPFEKGWDAFYKLLQIANEHMGMKGTAITNDTVQQASGVSKEWDYRKAEKIMVQMALNEQEAVKAIMDLVAKWRGGEWTGSIQYSTQFDMSTGTEDLDAVVKLQAARAPIEARRELLKRSCFKLMPSLSFEARELIEKAIDAMQDVLNSPFASPSDSTTTDPVMQAEMTHVDREMVNGR